MVSWLKTHKKDIGIAAVIFVIALLPRIIDLGTFLTADEKNWMERSYEFIRAFKDVRLNDMLQTTHPGVPALWVMGLAITAKMFQAGVPFATETLPIFITAAQFSMAFLNALAIPVMYLLLRRLFSSEKLLPLAVCLIVAVDPFIVGFSRVAHVDALLMSVVFIAALATMIYAQTGFTRFWLVVSAVLSGLAILTKAPAIFLVPFFWLAVLVYSNLLGRPSFRILRDNAGFVKNRFKDFILWALTIGIMFVVIWPVFLTVENPKGNANLLKRDLGAAITTPHHMSEDYSVQGLHYMYVLLGRTTPLVLVFAIVGLVGGVYMAVSKKSDTSQVLPPRTFWLLLGYIVFFILMMTLGAKKGGRYILPVYPAIDLLAVLGVWFVVERIRNARAKYDALTMLRSKTQSFLFGVSIAGVCIVLAATLISYHPYAIAYSNALYSDDLRAELGWGEGLDQVAAWLNEHDPKAHVASWYDQELAAFTSARAVTLGAHEQPHIKYVVLYNNMFGRAKDHPANDYIDEYYGKRNPVFVANVAGREYAWVYEKKTYPANTGELLSDNIQTTTLEPATSPVAGVEVLLATYNDRATQGEVVVELTDNEGASLYSWRTPVRQLEDDRWLRLLLPSAIASRDPFTVTVYAEGTSEGNAPTLRQSPENGLAVRLLYKGEIDIFHDEHSKRIEDSLR